MPAELEAEVADIWNRRYVEAAVGMLPINEAARMALKEAALRVAGVVFRETKENVEWAQFLPEIQGALYAWGLIPELPEEDDEKP